MLAVQQQKRLCRQFVDVSAERRGCHYRHLAQHTHTVLPGPIGKEYMGPELRGPQYTLHTTEAIRLASGVARICCEEGQI